MALAHGSSPGQLLVTCQQSNGLSDTGSRAAGSLKPAPTLVAPLFVSGTFRLSGRLKAKCAVQDTFSRDR